ncbi:hypothetical protein X777_00126 [Ooceraea biroi]|nr:hypothetical protein X777_00126 [Ooceraea biroi]
MIGDNDDFALSVPVMPTSSSVQNRISPLPAILVDTKSTTLESDSSSSSSSSDSTSSDSEAEASPSRTTNGHLNSATASPTLFMPNNLLNDDLQLSESESDSDSN